MLSKYWVGSFFKIPNKYWDFQLTYCEKIERFLYINLNWNRHSDHAGFNLGFEILWFSIYFNIYDSRHWDYDNNCWYKYNEKED